jgi:LasA protease
MVDNRWNRFEFCHGFNAWWVRSILVLFLGVLLTACSSTRMPLSPTITETPFSTPSPTLSPTPLPPTPIPQSPTSSPEPPTPTLTPTPVPYPPEHWQFPDSEVVYSPSVADFNVVDYLDKVGGFLGTYKQYLMITDWTTGADIVTRVALENSINPRLLLALLEYQSGCVRGEVDDPEEFDTAMGAANAIRLDLYGQLVWAVHELSEGFYGWRTGDLTEFSLTDGTVVTPDLRSNAGTISVQYFFSKLYGAPMYAQAVDPVSGFYALYEEMFGNPWERAAVVEPLISAGVEQPALTLPFAPGKAWAYTGGPHFAFESSGPLAALDFAPPAAETGCYQSEDWIIAMADGLVVRSELGAVVQDLDGDGYEQTGWVLMYLHVESRHRVPVGTNLIAGDQIGHPSCEGGRATGSHVHIARKFNGEWIPADGEIPFDMDGWVAHNGEKPYLGTLTREGEVVTAHQFGSYISRISRDE